MKKLILVALFGLLFVPSSWASNYHGSKAFSHKQHFYNQYQACLKSKPTYLCDRHFSRHLNLKKQKRRYGYNHGYKYKNRRRCAYNTYDHPRDKFGFNQRHRKHDDHIHANISIHKYFDNGSFRIGLKK